jgi:amino-acid N-acetyltransferase
MFLLTTTAEAFFRRFGYLPVDRETLPDAVRSSAEFASCAAADATAMSLRLS